MGMAHIYAHTPLLRELESGKYDNIRVLAADIYEYPDLWLTLVESHHLPEGYNYHMDLIIKGDSAILKKGTYDFWES